MNNLDTQYQALLQDILDTGIQKKDRTGTGTLSVFGRQIRHNMQEGFPLLTTKKMAIKSVMTELKWFLKGDTNIQYLVQNGCNIWNGDAYKNFKSTFSQTPGIQSSLPTMDEFIDEIKTDDKFAEKWGELGPIYGKQWRRWRDWRVDRMHFDKDETLATYTPVELDQIKTLIKQLRKNPDSRRLMVSAWNVAEMDSMVLPPCHYGFQVYTRELSFEERYEKHMGPGNTYNGNAYGKISTLDILDEADVPTRAISLIWNQRSVDTFLGLPFNIASYGMLLSLIAEEVNMVPDQLIGNLGDTHLYLNHIQQAKEQLERDSFSLPKLKLSNVELLKGEFDYEILNYNSHPTIKAPLSN